MNKPFDLEAFKVGQKALTREGYKAKFINICEECEEFSRLLVLLEGEDQVMFYNLNGKFEQSIGAYNESRYDLVSMVSRHQSLIDSYDPEDMWQWSRIGKNAWAADATPSWDEKLDYRLHPHNDLIKAWKKGAKIEAFQSIPGGSYWLTVACPSWNEHYQYRIKPEPNTKTVYEWIHEANVGNVNYFVSSWVADEDVGHFFGLDAPRQKYKTGRSWEVEV